MGINLVLASGSPRRRQLLLAAGYEFQVIVPDDAVESEVSKSLAPEQFVAEASLRKARAIAPTLSDSIVIAADTVAVCEGRILGKPADREHAKSMLLSLSGKPHRVLTGTTVWNCTNARTITDVDSTELRMDVLDDDELSDYLDGGDWVGKAGGFGYQDGLDWVSIVEGLESNVVGLPIEKLPKLIAAVTEIP